MALYFSIHVLGFNILLLITLAQAFVLLTANMEDVKKLARKFVSESLAEQIAEFIAKLGTNPVNLSEENEENREQYSQSSGEKYNKYLGRDSNRQRPDKFARPRGPIEQDRAYTRKVSTTYIPPYNWPKYVRDSPMTQHLKNADNSDSNKNRDVQKLNKNRQRPQQKLFEKQPDSQNGKPRNEMYSSKLVAQKKRDDTHNTVNYAKSTNDRNNNRDEDSENVSKYSYREEKYVSSMKPEEILRNHLDNQAEYYEMNKKNKLKKRRNKLNSLTSRLTTLELNKDYSETFNEESSTNKYRFKNIAERDFNKEDNYNNGEDSRVNRNVKRADDSLVDSSDDLTTAKQKNEFDQYDNRYYAKSEFVATSGPVALKLLTQDSK